MTTEEHQKALSQVKSGRVALFIVGGFSLLVGLYVFTSGNNILHIDETVIIDAILLLIFAFVSYRYPLLGLGLGLGLYVLGQIFVIIENPEMITKGIIVKMYVIYALSMGIKGAYSLKGYKKEEDLFSKIEEIGQDDVEKDQELS